MSGFHFLKFVFLEVIFSNDRRPVEHKKIGLRLSIFSQYYKRELDTRTQPFW